MGSAREDDITIFTGEAGHDHAERGPVARKGLSTATPAKHRPCYFSLGFRKVVWRFQTRVHAARP